MAFAGFFADAVAAAVAPMTPLLHDSFKAGANGFLARLLGLVPSDVCRCRACVSERVEDADDDVDAVDRVRVRVCARAFRSCANGLPTPECLRDAGLETLPRFFGRS